MAYFEMFPSVFYDMKGDGQYTLVKDLMSRVKLVASVKENILNFDYYEDWPMSVQKFEQFIFDKYENPQAIHHYEITQTSGDTTKTIDVGMNTTEYPSATAIDNYTYEDRLQTKKRQIRLIQPQYIEQFVSEFDKKINENV